VWSQEVGKRHGRAPVVFPCDLFLFQDMSFQ